MNRSTLRIGFRLARRELRRSPGRAALVIAMVFIPTCAMGVVATINRATYRSPADRHAEVYGQASQQYVYRRYLFPFRVGPLPTPDEIRELKARTGPGVSVEHSVLDRVRRGDATSDLVEVTDVDLDNPVVRGRFDLIRGRSPAAGEATLSKQTAEDLGAAVGDVVMFDRLGTSLRIVGIVERQFDYPGLVVIGDPITINAATKVYSARPDDHSFPFPEGWGTLTESFGTGLDEAWRAWNLLGGAVGLFALGAVIAAAFAIGARRAVRTVGLLAASGASSAVVACSLLAQGLIAGTIGSVMGAIVGTAGVRILPLSVLRELTNRHAHAALAHPVDLFAIVAVGVVAATLAAVYPARVASRVSVLQALGARRPQTSARRGHGVAAVVLATAGALVAGWGLEEVRLGSYRDLKALAAATAGALAVATAGLLAAPIAVGTYERIFGARALSWRLAARSLARNHTRSVSVLGAICVVVGVIVATTSLAQSWATSTDSGFGSYGVPIAAPNQVVVASRYASDNYFGSQLRHPSEPPQPPASLVASVRKIVPDARPVDPVWVGAEVRGPGYLLSRGSEDGLSGGPFGNTRGVGIATPELLDLFDIPASVRDRLGLGDAITINSPGNESNFRRRRDIDRDEPTLQVIAQFTTSESSQALPRVLVSQATADANGWHRLESGATVLVAPKRLSPAQVRQLRALATDAEFDSQAASPGVGEVYRADDVWVDPLHADELGTTTPAARVLGFGVASAFVLAIIGVGLALAARDANDESAVLDAVGAEPRERRRIGTRRATILVGTAAALGAPLALVTVAIIVALSGRENVAFRVDWVALALVTIALPLVVAAASAAGGWLRDRVRPLQASAFIFADD